MSELEELIALYTEWSDIQLLEAFQNKKDYSPIGVSGMKEVLKERGYWEGIMDGNLESLLKEEYRLSENAQKARVEGRSLRALADELDADENGIYAKSLIIGGPKSKSRNKGELIAIKDQEKVKINIKTKKVALDFVSPFDISYYATKTDKRVNFFKVSFWYTLYMHFKLNNGESIIIHCDLIAYKELPARWELIDFDNSILSADYKFEYFSNEIRLIDLKKLTDKFLL